jgi:hypothetical protein
LRYFPCPKKFHYYKIQHGGLGVIYIFVSLKGPLFLRCGVLVNLKKKGVLLCGSGRGKEFYFKELFFGWGWVVGRKRRDIPFLPPPFFFIIW